VQNPFKSLKQPNKAVSLEMETLIRENAMWLRKRPKVFGEGFFPRMSCWPLCGFHELRRFHISCVVCRHRRYFYGKLDRSKYHFNRLFGRIIMPNDVTHKVLFKRVYKNEFFILRGPKGQRIVKAARVLVDERPFYNLWVDNNRKFAHVKDIFLEKVFKKMEQMENEEGRTSFPKKLYKHLLYNIAEMLAN
jgi:hypothetical protein